jgi:hypothetical protein
MKKNKESKKKVNIPAIVFWIVLIVIITIIISSIFIGTKNAIDECTSLCKEKDMLYLRSNLDGNLVCSCLNKNTMSDITNYYVISGVKE